MADPQERPDGDLHWLGGIMDGEASFSICTRRDVFKRIHLVPEVQIGNSSPIMVSEIKRILALHDLPVWVSERPAGVSKRTKIAWQLMARGPKRVERWLKVLVPYLRSRRHDAMIVYDFVKSRLSKPHVMPYSEQELTWCDQLRKGNRVRVSSETLRQTLAGQILGAPKRVKIKSELTTKA